MTGGTSALVAPPRQSVQFNREGQFGGDAASPTTRPNTASSAASSPVSTRSVFRRVRCSGTTNTSRIRKWPSRQLPPVYEGDLNRGPTIAGVGFRGKALLLWTTFQPAAGATTLAVLSMGMTDGVLQVVRCLTVLAGEATPTSAQAEQTKSHRHKVTATSGASPAVLVAGAFGTFTDDSFTINWTTNDSEAGRHDPRDRPRGRDPGRLHPT